MSQIKLELSPFWTNDLELNALTMIMVDCVVKQTSGNIDANRALDMVTDKLSHVSPESITKMLDDYYNKNKKKLNMMSWDFRSLSKPNKN
jgi:hypothetical protein